MSTVALTWQDVCQGQLMLINAENPIKRATAVNELAPVTSSYAAILFNKKAASQLELLVSQVNGQEQIVPTSGYRSIEEQRTIYQNSLVKHGREFTNLYVAKPGCSEHQTGLAIDLAEANEQIDFIRPAFPDEGVFRQFKQLASQYGFIERYPVWGTNRTHIGHEPWHFRYVGHPHAELIKLKQFTLEDYIDFLEQFEGLGKSLEIEVNGQCFTIVRISIDVKQTTTFEIPERMQYMISGNNRDSVIVTLWEE
ncbi:D-alanyl-D-alanine dipeptidase/carboxypeptidase [Amphibacillus marinus]|uniref:D-alanyl-D-alanine dipeptidase/carboxypeptidase n=1 Tax=Amphibacillus marinus TaxID=872970 RepID=A0A1H8JSW1_9BACI|nr:D-alanyl-D-alanine carboxypeptidase family protein [Amphibacillus marinus]SEN83467.1 D-alanyl-D-alanine dipeptidase/carboxypeptidase [Amphibacillus marinus]